MTSATVAATMKLLSSPRPKAPCSHARSNVSKDRLSGIEKPVTRSLRSWKASRTMERMG